MDFEWSHAGATSNLTSSEMAQLARVDRAGQVPSRHDAMVTSALLGGECRHCCGEPVRVDGQAAGAPNGVGVQHLPRAFQPSRAPTTILYRDTMFRVDAGLPTAARSA